MCQETIAERFRQRIKQAREYHLEELDFSNGNLTQIPDEIWELTHLKVLNIKWK